MSILRRQVSAANGTDALLSGIPSGGIPGSDRFRRCFMTLSSSSLMTICSFGSERVDALRCLE